ENGFRDEMNPKDRNELYRLSFKIFFMDIPIEEKIKTPIKKKPKDLTMEELKEKIAYLRNLKIFPKDLIIEFHKRISISLSPLIFVILGFGIATRVRHREKSINFGVTFLLAVSYYLLLILGETLAKSNIVVPSLGMWIPNIIFLILGIYLVRRCTF
ncbi:MAG: LptF/LptG family permease, partial [Candidatus Omnitrophica bacterium]|nr:LptF/LptG family permease [Candidatus Omnitrophota bacterium]